MKKYKDKYRIRSARAPFWNYGSIGYFITICTHNRKRYFGQVIKAEMQLSDIGQIADEEWRKTFDMRPDMNLRMGEYVVMPDHFHAVVVIGENQFNQCQYNGQQNPAITTGTNPTSETQVKNVFGPQSKNPASVIRGFKIGVTRRARLIHAEFAWQSRFHDRIIRDEHAYRAISKYIVHNPKNWNE